MYKIILTSSGFWVHCGLGTAMSWIRTQCYEKVLSPFVALQQPWVDSWLDVVKKCWVHLGLSQGQEWNQDSMMWEVPESTCGPLKARSGLWTPDIVRKCSVQLRPSHSHEETQDLELWEGPESTWGPPSARCGLRSPDIVRRCWVHLCPSTTLSGQDKKVLSPIVALLLLEVDLGPLTLWEGVESTCGPPQPWVDSGWKVYQFINIF